MKLFVFLAVSLMAAVPSGADTAIQAAGGVVRWLDKVSGETGDIDLSRGQSAQTGRLTIQLDDCRYPSEDSPSDAYAHLTVMDRLQKDPVFSGWMLADSPALSAMDHPRYDVWVLRCLTE
jgi:hypothetical protein